MIKITMRDVRASGMCGTGMRKWLRRHGFTPSDWAEGLTPEQLEATGDPMAIKVAEAARGRQQ